MRRYMVLIVLMLAVASPLQAHKVMLFAVRDGGRIFAEGYFGDGKKAIGAEIEVFDETGARVMTGRTDSEGALVFDAPSAGELRLVMNASMGHRAEFVLAAADDRAAPESAEAETEQSATEAVVPDEAALRRIVDEALDARLVPLVQAVVDSRQQGPSITEIFGGIGYIFGLMGLVMYFRSRRQG